MKKRIYIAIVFSISIGLSNSVIAIEENFFSSIFDTSNFEKDFSASVGLKMWVNEWEYPTVLTFSPTSTNNMVRSQHSDTVEFAFIPALNLKYKNFFVSSSYFPETDYSFEIQDVLGFTSKFDAKRSEWDINFGYYILPSLAVMAGYKNINREFGININGNQMANAGKADTNGLTLSIAGAAPLRGQFGLYGNFAYGWLDTEKNLTFSGILGEQYGNFDVEYYLGEFGLKYFSRLKNFYALEAASVYMGYRFQSLNEERGSLDNGRPLEITDTTSGFVFGVNLSF